MKDNIFKCFGISKDEVRNILSPFLKDNKGVFISIDGKQLLVDILLQAEDSNTFFYELSHEIYERFSKYVYAEADISLEQTAFELLKLNGIKLATAESITGGNLIGSLIKYNPGASDFIVEGAVVYTNESKIKRLGVSKQILDRYSSVSVETTYDMAKGLLETTSADLVISTTGYASSSTGREDVGLVFIGIGDRKKIDIYKNKFVGDRDEIIETATSSALFYLIKKLRKNDFFLERNNI